MKIEVGDIVETKKKHPCGSFKFEILRKGVDFKMKCLVCSKEIWVERIKLEKKIKKINNESVRKT